MSLLLIIYRGKSKFKQNGLYLRNPIQSKIVILFKIMKYSKKNNEIQLMCATFVNNIYNSTFMYFLHPNFTIKLLHQILIIIVRQCSIFIYKLILNNITKSINLR